ncbi:AAA family ATPase [Streptomyces sp. NPDC127098]|uniref:AAA family ATPase n=1 Tax=Streptomyces sp. NPDC127098 TaxID=3347137 RepID=UPI0036615531
MRVPQLVGRDRELGETNARLRGPGGPRLVVVRAEPGGGRTSFARALAARLRAEGLPCPVLTCVAGDEGRPLLLALRLVTAVRGHRAGAVPSRPADRRGLRALIALEEGDATAMGHALREALTRSPSMVVVVDDLQRADPESLALLGGFGVERWAPGFRLVVTAVQRAPAGETPPAGDDPPLAQLVRRAADEIVLRRLAAREVGELLTRRLAATPDPGLVRRVRELSRGIPAAVDALLAGWTRQGAIRNVGGHAFLSSEAPVPVLPDDDRFVVALRALGEPGGTVARALSVLWPLGRAAPALAAAWSALSADEVHAGIRGLVKAGVMDRLHDADGRLTRGWTFRVPLVEHAVRERLGPVERARLSAVAVEALWTAGEPTVTGTGRRPPAASLLDEADAETYLPDRIAEAGVLVDRRRAAADLTAAAQQIHPDRGGRGMTRWLRAAHLLVDEPAARELALLRYGKGAYVAGEYSAARAAAETILREPVQGLTAITLQDTAVLLVAAAAGEGNRPLLDRIAAESWWRESPLPTAAVLSARALALSQSQRWRETRDLLARTASLWNADPLVRVLPEWFGACAEWVLGRPDRFRRAVATPLAPELPPEWAYSLTTSQFDQLLGARDLAAATALLSARGLPVEALPPYSRFLRADLLGRWDEALTLARGMLADGRTFSPAPGHHLLHARWAAILLAQGRATSATRLLRSVRGDREGQLELFLDHAEAEVGRALGDTGSAERLLRRGLREAEARGQVYGTDELWASLAALQRETGRLDEAAHSAVRLRRTAERLGSGRAHLLSLLVSADVLPREDTDATRRLLLEAVALARSRDQPFETAATLSAVARAGVGPKEQLYEAYELFGETGAALWRFHTRTAMREAALSVPGRRQVAEENDRLLATLVAEGLSNRRIAVLLRLTEEAVATRLSRLLTRTGLRSRAEVATLLLAGDPLTVTDR